MTNLNYNEYKAINGMFAVLTKAQFVKMTVARNLSPSVVAPRGRSVNGGQIGNRHALKHNIRMWDHSGNVISRGEKPVDSSFSN